MVTRCLRDNSAAVSSETARLQLLVCQSNCPHGDIEVVLHLELLHGSQSLQRGDIFYLVVAHVQETEEWKFQVPWEFLKPVPRQIQVLQGDQAREQLHWKVLVLQPQFGQTKSGKWKKKDNELTAWIGSN